MIHSVPGVTAIFFNTVSGGLEQFVDHILWHFFPFLNKLLGKSVEVGRWIGLVAVVNVAPNNVLQELDWRQIWTPAGPWQSFHC